MQRMGGFAGWLGGGRWLRWPLQSEGVVFIVRLCLEEISGGGSGDRK